jgi:hypothetical protein
MIKYFLETATQGCNYWAEFRKPVYDDENNLISVQVRDGGKENDPVRKNWMTIDAKKIMKGRTMLLDGNVQVAREYAAQFIGTEHEWDYDVWGADCLVQAVYFGEIVYG